jgi:UDP-4-amino-4,6-dideoxy-N-acetyl-beta-L-altrosamine transaminase
MLTLRIESGDMRKAVEFRLADEHSLWSQMIPYGRQDVTDSDVDAVVEILRSDFLTQGPTVPRFERAVAERVGAQHAIAVNSATSALHIGCVALGLGPGDRLWTVPNTFVASANCARYCGADVDFVDIDSGSWNMSISELEKKLREAKACGRLPKVVVPVHFAGQPTEQEAIWRLAKDYGFAVLEDASHSIGASRNAEPVGSCRWSDITVFSFHPVKIITTAEGGMALTNDPFVANRMALLRSHGITRDPARFTTEFAGVGSVGAGANSPPWHYEQQVLGFNYRMTDVQAALGLSQLERLTEYVERRNAFALRYDDMLNRSALQLPVVHPNCLSAYHLYVVRLKAGAHRSARRRVFEQLRQLGIGVNVHYTPVHLQPYYRELGFLAGQFPEAEAHGDTAITLPLYPGLTERQQDQVISALNQALQALNGIL